MDTRAKLIHFLSKYGNDFFHKLPKYKTAKFKEDYVRLIKFCPENLDFLCEHKKDQVFIDLFSLDDFCL